MDQSSKEGAAAELQALEARMAEASVFGQWQVGATRPDNATIGPSSNVSIEPKPGGDPFIWRWSTMEPFLVQSLEAMPESFTARRSLTLKNPTLPRGATHTMVVGLQTIGPGEIAWAHRHSITALRFVIDGSKDVFTVVDGEPLPMEPYDLILTPGWRWHDHHNRSDRPAVWLDALDVPLMMMLNQTFYEELGEEMQQETTGVLAGSPLLRPVGGTVGAGGQVNRFPWAEVRRRLDSLASAKPSPFDGIALEYCNPDTGGSTLATLGCWAQMLPPGFKGEMHRHTSSAVYFVVGGAGCTKCGDSRMEWGRHDTFVVPNWSWHAHENLSETEPAFLFSVNDIPIMKPFGLYREEPASN
ncbi:MAG: hypothetical protein RLZ98_1836 [Pseudomonadota bacterium]|jgi:1-hydroxy-2-naphthoate dioxygenase